MSRTVDRTIEDLDKAMRELRRTLRGIPFPGVPQLTGDLVHIRSRLCWSAAHGIGQQAKSPSNTTCGWSLL